MFKGNDVIAYKETINHTFTSEEVAGLTIGFSLQYFNEKFTGATEQEKIAAAIASGRGGDKTEELKVSFPKKPEDPAVTPTDFVSSDVTTNSVVLKWTAGSAKGKYWVVYVDNKKFGTTSKTLTVNDALYGSALAGLSLNFTVKEFNDTYADADTADKSGKGSAASSQVKVDFPEEPAITPTSITQGEVSKDSGTINWNRGSKFGKSTTIEYADGVSVGRDYTEGTDYTLTDKIFGEALAGKKIKFTLREYNDVYEGNTSRDKANAAERSKKGSDPSEAIEIEFPSQLKIKKAR